MRTSLFLCLSACGGTTIFSVHSTIPAEAWPADERVFLQFDGQNVVVNDYCGTVPPGDVSLDGSQELEGRCAVHAEIAIFREPATPCEPNGESLEAEPSSEPVFTYTPTGDEPCEPLDKDRVYDPELMTRKGRFFEIRVELPDLQ